MRLIRATHSDCLQSNVSELFNMFPKISIDYALTEKQGIDSLFLMAGDYGWIDFGNWDEWARFFEGSDNTALAVQVNCGNNLILSDGSVDMRLVGIQDSIIIIADGKVLVCRKGHSQHVKQIA